MKSTRYLHLISALIIAAFALQSCANIDIVKRKHRPGFHVDVKGKKQRQKVANVEPERAEVTLESVAAKPATPIESAAEASMPSTQLAFSSSNVQVQNQASSESKLSQLLRTTYPSVKREKLNGELRRAVFNKKEEDEKYGWSTVSIISTGLGLFALGFFITGIVLLISFIFTAGFAFWWIFALLGLVFGIAAMVTGIIGMRQTGSGEKRGRGFAIAGMVAGIVSLAGALIAAFWGLIYSIINGSGDDF